MLPVCFSTYTESSSQMRDGDEAQYPILSTTDFDAAKAVADIQRAAAWNQGERTWDPDLCFKAVANYEAHLSWLQYHHSYQPDDIPEGALDTLLASHVVERALKAMIRMRIDTPELSQRVRAFEKTIGSFKQTPLTPKLSLRLLEANGKAGNVGRAIALLQLRKAKGYPAVPAEFDFAVQSIISAGQYYRQYRNVYLGEKYQSELENPTRWLDAILLNMSSRKNKMGETCPLTEDMVGKLLLCYVSTGRNGKALHYFYRVKTKVVDPSKLEDMDISIKKAMPMKNGRRVKVKIEYNSSIPPHYKVPSEVCGTNRLPLHKDERPTMSTLSKPPSKLAKEESKDWSAALAGSFAFAESLTHGACGHDPITLTVEHWNVLIKACCYKGALTRALHLIEEVIPRNGLEANTNSYNHIFRALSRVGDVVYTRTFFTEMSNKGISPDKFTVEVCSTLIYLKFSLLYTNSQP